MDSELLLKFIGYFPDDLSALSRTLLRLFGQPLSKQLYTIYINVTALFHSTCTLTLICQNLQLNCV